MPGDRSVNVAGREIAPDQFEPEPGANRSRHDAEKKLRALKAEQEVGGAAARERTGSSGESGVEQEEE